MSPTETPSPMAEDPGGTPSHLKALVSIEREGWILRRIAEAALVQNPSLECRAASVDDAPPKPEVDAVFYSSWHHFWTFPAAYRRLPSVALVTHLDRHGFRLAYMSLRYGTRILCMSERYRKRLHLYGVPRSRTALAPLGVDLDLFRPGAGQAPGERLRIGIVGRLYPDGRKGEDFLYDMLQTLDRDQIELVIVGDRWEPALQRLRATIGTVDYHQNVPTAELPGLYAGMDALLITSRIEGGPVPALEALACGTPLISTNVGYVPDLLAAVPEAGRIVQTPRDAAETLAGARELKHALQPKMRQMRSALADYTWSAFSEHVSEALRQVSKKA